MSVAVSAALLLGGTGEYTAGTSTAPRTTHSGTYPTVLQSVQGQWSADPALVHQPTEPLPIEGLTP